MWIACIKGNRHETILCSLCVGSSDILCLHAGDVVQLLVESCERGHPMRHTVVTLFVSLVLATYVAVKIRNTRTTETKE